MEPGIYCAHKPVGPTSFSVLREIAPPDRRSCHGGTLDPFASGLLLVLIEPATQLFDLLHDIPKVYEATILWGTETANGDPTGNVIASGSAEQLTPGSIEQAMRAFVGWHEQVPPSTSNKRVDGERAYVRAHRGETFELPSAPAYLHAAEWLDHHLPERSRVRLTVRGGFYVRSLIRDLGRSLGCPAHIESLRRTAIGPWNDPGFGQLTHVEPMPWLERRVLTDADVRELKNGNPIASGTIEPARWKVPANFPEPTPFVGGVHSGRFSFILERHEDTLRTNRLLRGGIQL